MTSTTSASTGPGSAASFRAMWDAGVVSSVASSTLPWAKDIAAALLEVVDPRPRSQALDEGIRLALGDDDPYEHGTIAKLSRRIEVWGPAAFLLPKKPDIDTLASRLRPKPTPARKSMVEPVPACGQALPADAVLPEADGS